MHLGHLALSGGLAGANGGGGGGGRRERSTDVAHGAPAACASHPRRARATECVSSGWSTQGREGREWRAGRPARACEARTAPDRSLGCPRRSRRRSHIGAPAHARAPSRRKPLTVLCMANAGGDREAMDRYALPRRLPDPAPKPRIHAAMGGDELGTARCAWEAATYSATAPEAARRGARRRGEKTLAARARSPHAARTVVRCTAARVARGESQVAVRDGRLTRKGRRTWPETVSKAAIQRVSGLRPGRGARDARHGRRAGARVAQRGARTSGRAWRRSAARRHVLGGAPGLRRGLDEGRISRGWWREEDCTREEVSKAGGNVSDRAFSARSARGYGMRGIASHMARQQTHEGLGPLRAERPRHLLWLCNARAALIVDRVRVLNLRPFRARGSIFRAELVHHDARLGPFAFPDPASVKENR